MEQVEALASPEGVVAQLEAKVADNVNGSSKDSESKDGLDTEDNDEVGADAEEEEEEESDDVCVPS